MLRSTLLATFLSAAAMLVACGPSSPGDGGDASLPDDADGDGISDDDEGRPDAVDTDDDGDPDYQDADSDGDGIRDSTEAGDGDLTTPPVDSDGDGVPDFRDLDSDDNGRSDQIDGEGDPDADGVGDYADLDDDGDQISDVNELGDDPLNPLDTDSDTTPDYQDLDSDADTIADLDELRRDPDADSIPAFRDLDSDGDCRLDSVEAGDADLATPPVNTDGDPGADFLDTDSDNDGLLDSQEDADCDGIADSGETSAVDDDTDGDGVTDLVEEVAGTDPNNPGDNPQSHGDFVFLVPYEGPPDPPDDTLDFSTNISQADVFFTMDTTGSMSGEIANLESSLNSIITATSASIPNIGFGVGGYDDIPCCGWGSAGSGDLPWYLLHRIMTTSTAAGRSSVQTQVNALTTHYGADGNESGWEAMYQVATGAGMVIPGVVTTPAFNAGTAYPTSPPAGETTGTLGGVGFRVGSLPIVVWITDAGSHNGNAGSEYSYGEPATRAEAITALNAINARVIGVKSLSGDTDPTTDLQMVVNGTEAIVPPAAWGTVGVDRPAGCSATQCCTGLNGAGQAPVGGQCPLLFTVDGAGSGLGTAIIRAIEVLTSFASIDIGNRIEDDPSDSVDAVAAFVDHLEAEPAAGGTCANIPAIDTNSDTYLDTFPDAQPGTTVCFDVIPKSNTTVPGTSVPQMFQATITVTGDGVTDLDSRDVYFLVPPHIDEPVE